MYNVVVIGGGTGLSSLIRGLKNITKISNLSAIVTVADNGGSTKEIRESYNIPAVGDLRQVVVALSKNESILEEIFKYRFDNRIPSLKNHSLGNLIISSLIDIENNFYKGIDDLKKIFDLKGNLLPITDFSSIEICAKYADGTIAKGETSIPNKDKKIETIYYENVNEIKPNPKVIQAIEQADFIIFGVGSLYTSVIPNLTLPEVRQAIIKNTQAKKVYFGNIMTQPGETDNMSMYDHTTAIEHHLEHNIIDYVIVDNSKLSNKLLEKYRDVNSSPVKINDKLINSHMKVFKYSLVDTKGNTIKHNDKKVKKCFEDFLCWIDL